MRIDSGLFDNSLISLGAGQKSAAAEGGEGSFADMFGDMMDAYEAASAESKESTAELVTGDLDNISDLLVNTEKSGIMFDLNLAVRNKVLDAFNEIMKTQV